MGLPLNRPRRQERPTKFWRAGQKFDTVIGMLHRRLGTIVLGLLVALCDNTAAPSQNVMPGRVILYEENPAPDGRSYVGTVVWSLQPEILPGRPTDKAIRAYITIPERNMTVTFTLRRNANKDVLASHTVSINFELPADFPHGGIQEIRGLLMKMSESTRGVGLAGLSVRVTRNFFVIGLSWDAADFQRNIQMLKERGWFDVAIVYNDNRRAILAVEKGAAGDRATKQAFAFWGTPKSPPKEAIVAPPRLPEPSPPKVSTEKFNGSGFFVNDTGYVLTNAHVVDGCINIAVRTSDGQFVPARTVAANDADDLAVLATSVHTRQYAIFRSSPAPRSGDPIVVFGFPLVELLASTGNATFGNITALAGLRDNTHEMQISAPVQPGNSGGPVLDSSGRVLGVVVSKLDALRMARLTQDVPQNINFAIKGSTARDFLDAYGISHSSVQSDKELSPADIVERAKSFSVTVQCER
jgi:S1-C subfamily serine protease